jgi:hypothetical protein
VTILVVNEIVELVKKIERRRFMGEAYNDSDFLANQRRLEKFLGNSEAEDLRSAIKQLRIDSCEELDHNDYRQILEKRDDIAEYRPTPKKVGPKHQNIQLLPFLTEVQRRGITAKSLYYAVSESKKSEMDMEVVLNWYPFSLPERLSMWLAHEETGDTDIVELVESVPVAPSTKNESSKHYGIRRLFSKCTEGGSSTLTVTT